MLFCENNTNKQKLYGAENETEFVKDGINDYIVQGKTEAVNPRKYRNKSGGELCFGIKRRRRKSDSSEINDQRPLRNDGRFDVGFKSGSSGN